MENQDHGLVRQTWAKAAAAHVDLARLFYGRLFRIAPDTKALFENDMDQQGRKLAATLGFVIDHLSDEAKLVPAAQNLAVKHLDYDVKIEHYEAVSKALLWTLEELLGSDFNDQARAAWSVTLDALTSVMTDAAYPPATTGS